MKNNLDSILDQTFDYAKSLAKDFYFKAWSKNPPACPATDFWRFEAETDGINIKVIIRSINGGSKHFYSVMRKGSVQQEIDG